MAIGEQIEATRQRRGWSKNRLAGQAHIGRGHLSKIEEGRILTPTRKVLQRLCRALDVTLEQLEAVPEDGAFPPPPTAAEDGAHTAALHVAPPEDGSPAAPPATVPAAIAAALHQARTELPADRYDLLVEMLTTMIALSRHPAEPARPRRPNKAATAAATE